MMGGGGPMNEEQMDNVKQQAMPIQELLYFTEGYSLELVALSKFDNQPAYIVEITDPNGKKTQEYYLVENKFKVREEYVMDTPQGKTISFSNYKNYQNFDNIKLPSTIEQGQQGQAIKLVLKDVKLNSNVIDMMFR